MIDIIIFAIIAAVIAYRLYNTLGAEDNNSEEVKGKVINLHPVSEDDEDKSVTIPVVTVTKEDAIKTLYAARENGIVSLGVAERVTVDYINNVEQVIKYLWL